MKKIGFKRVIDQKFEDRNYYDRDEMSLLFYGDPCNRILVGYGCLKLYGIELSPKHQSENDEISLKLLNVYDDGYDTMDNAIKWDFDSFFFCSFNSISPEVSCFSILPPFKKTCKIDLGVFSETEDGYKEIAIGLMKLPYPHDDFIIIFTNLGYILLGSFSKREVVKKVCKFENRVSNNLSLVNSSVFENCFYVSLDVGSFKNDEEEVNDSSVKLVDYRNDCVALNLNHKFEVVTMENLKISVTSEILITCSFPCYEEKFISIFQCTRKSDKLESQLIQQIPLVDYIISSLVLGKSFEEDRLSVFMALGLGEDNQSKLCLSEFKIEGFSNLTKPNSNDNIYWLKFNDNITEIIQSPTPHTARISRICLMTDDEEEKEGKITQNPLLLTCGCDGYFHIERIEGLEFRSKENRVELYERCQMNTLDLNERIIHLLKHINLKENREIVLKYFSLFVYKTLLCM